MAGWGWGRQSIALDVSHGEDGTSCVAEGEKRLPDVCEYVAGYLYQLALLDDREGSAQMSSSPCSRQVWVKNNICKTVPHGAFPSV